MVWPSLALLLNLVTVHAPDGETITLNAQEISSIRTPRDSDVDHLQKDVHCVLWMTNGKFIGTTESCVDIIRMIAAAEKRAH